MSEFVASRAATPEVSVIVATFNRGDSVARLLGQLAEQTLAPERFEVVVVDDGSTPPVADRLAALKETIRRGLVAFVGAERAKSLAEQCFEPPQATA